MEPIFLSIRESDGQVWTYPLSRLRCLYHNSGSGIVWADIDAGTHRLIEGCSNIECSAIEQVILIRIGRALSTWRVNPHPGSGYALLDLNDIASKHLEKLRAEEDEAREMTRLDAILEARERDRETGYDGVRPDHTELECRGGED